jgi:hypothetical protein
MKSTIFTIAGAALNALSSVQFASATEQHHRAHHRATEFRDSNAFVAPAYVPVDPYGSDSSWSRSVWSAPAGR